MLRCGDSEYISEVRFEFSGKVVGFEKWKFSELLISSSNPRRSMPNLHKTGCVLLCNFCYGDFLSQTLTVCSVVLIFCCPTRRFLPCQNVPSSLSFCCFTSNSMHIKPPTVSVRQSVIPVLSLNSNIPGEHFLFYEFLSLFFSLFNLRRSCWQVKPSTEFIF